MSDSIRNLQLVQSLDQADQVAVGSVSAGGDVRVPLSSLVSYIQSLLSVPTALVTQYASPSATGFTVAVSPTTTGTSMFLLLKPVGAYATGTINLPALASAVDGQEVLVHCTQAVTTLTVSGNGASTGGAPTTIAANGFFRMRYDGVDQKWYRVG